MSLGSDEYARHWKDYRAGPPAQDPRGPHHAGLHPDPEFVLMCADAERQGLLTGLSVAPGKKPMGATGQEYRTLTAITFRKPREPKPILSVGCSYREPLRPVAVRAREKLEALT